MNLANLLDRHPTTIMPSALLRQAWVWANTTRRRRWTTRAVVALLVVLGIPGLLDAVANATTDGSLGDSTSAAMGIPAVRDSSGVPITSYFVVSKKPGILNPIGVAVNVCFGFVFLIWILGSNFAIWILDFGVGLRIIAFIGKPVRSIANSMYDMFSSPYILISFAGIGAFIVAWFIMRGFYSKATMQIVVMGGTAVLGPLFLRDPIGELIGSDGWLALGRNLGISVGAGLSGDTRPNPQNILARMQADMVDAFVRKPLQILNFGHVVDGSPLCKANWSQGMLHGTEKGARELLEQCGDRAAVAMTDELSWGQAGNMLLLLLMGIVLWICLTRVSLYIMRTVIDGLAMAVATIFCFCAGGFVYGRLQIFMVRCAFHGAYCCFELAMVIAGTYAVMLLMSGQPIVISLLLVLLMLMRGKRFMKAFENGAEDIVNRFAAATQGGFGSPGKAAAVSGGSGGGGTSGAGAKRTLRNRAFTDLNNFNAMVGWQLSERLVGVPMMLKPDARRLRLAQQLGLPYLTDRRMVESGAAANYKNIQATQGAVDWAARYRRNFGAQANLFGETAAALQGFMRMGGTLENGLGGLITAGYANEEVNDLVIGARQAMESRGGYMAFQNDHLGLLSAASRHAENTAMRLMRSEATPQEVAASYANLYQIADQYRINTGRAVSLDRPDELDGPMRRYVAAFIGRPQEFDTPPDLGRMKALELIVDGKEHLLMQGLTAETRPGNYRGLYGDPDFPVTQGIVSELTSIFGDSFDNPQKVQIAQRMLSATRIQLSDRYLSASRYVLDHPTDPQGVRDLRWLDFVHSETKKAVPSFDTAPTPPRSTEIPEHLRRNFAGPLSPVDVLLGNRNP
ncbi:hypothetical protein D5S18_00910 [Nocardia panacis]|uniref:Uncharacterized protein n=1 Tax=Nocardia panacis TaxID=2340916 RepID=A0A3A4KTZ9_9NOCA|nr:hypothetical protein [Nocardia panacis]RJO79866.1 hypothetical protein D5S18_00910 [Nocardia panacis]